MSVLSTSGCEQKRSQSVWMSGFKENAGMCITTETQGNISHSFSVSNTDLNQSLSLLSYLATCQLRCWKHLAWLICRFQSHQGLADQSILGYSNTCSFVIDGCKKKKKKLLPFFQKRSIAVVLQNCLFDQFYFRYFPFSLLFIGTRTINMVAS